MSSIYATEPATAGRVIFETTNGPLEIYLWSRECPVTTRLFLQFCLDGFYNDMVFHRVINDFMIQTGALRHDSSSAAPISMSSPEAASYRQSVGAAQALDRRPYEVNSRIRFNHRGQVAMALGVKDTDDAEDLQPQFFITLDEAPYLDGKHVVFGTVSGPTIFNALRIGRVETDETTHTPLDMPNATRIQSVKIIENPIHVDLVPQPQVPWKSVAKSSQNDGEAAGKKKRKKRKGKFDINVLSFGDEFQEEEMFQSVKKKGMQSSHDLVESKVLSKQVDEQVKEVVMDGAEKEQDKNNGDSASFSKKRRLDSSSEHANNNHQQRENEDESAVRFSSRKGRNDAKPSSSAKDEESSQDGQTRETKERNATNPPAPKQSLVEARRLKYTKGKKSKKEREEETLAKLMSFRSTIQQEVEVRKSSSSGGKVEPQDNSLAARMARKAEKANGSTHENKEQAPTYHGQVLESDDEEAVHDNEGEKKRSWLGTAFKCRRHMDDDKRGGDGRAADDYEVIDTKKHRRDKKHKHHRHDRDHKGTKHRHHRRDK